MTDLQQNNEQICICSNYCKNYHSSMHFFNCFRLTNDNENGISIFNFFKSAENVELLPKKMYTNKEI